jgi:uncharacterized UPF0160 family protein
VEEYFDQKLCWIAKRLIPGRETIRKAIKDRKKVLATGEILYIPHYVPVELHQDLIDGDENKKHSIKYIVMPRAVGDAGVYALKWRPNFRRLKYGGQRDDRLTSLLQGDLQQGWIHRDGTVGAWASMQNAIEYLKQTLKQPEKAGNPIL